MGTFDGLSGRIGAKVMEKSNADAEKEAIARLSPPPDSRILVIGFGPGLGLEGLLKQPVAQVVGVDPSGVMNSIARKRNSAAALEGRLVLIEDKLEAIGDDIGTFDGAIAVHTLQICKPFARAAERLSILLRERAKLVSITHGWAARRDYGSEQAFIDEITSQLGSTGFIDVFTGKANAEGGEAILIEAIR